MAVTRSSPFIIPLESDKGQQIQQESYFNHLLPYFCNQVNFKYCGFCSAAICLNEILEKRQPSGPHRDISDLAQLKNNKETLGEDDLFAIGVDRSIIRRDDVLKDGITLDTFAKLISSIGLRGRFYYAYDLTCNQQSTMSRCPGIYSVDKFRSLVVENLKKPGTHVVVNYHFLTFFAKVNMGHFSPLGGYHFEEDRFLLMDVWPSHPVGWVKTEKLFEAMISKDISSQMPRGFCIIDAITL